MVEGEPLKKQHISITESLEELNQISKEVIEGLQKANSSIEVSKTLQDRMQKYTLAAVKNFERIEKEKDAEVKRRVLWQTIALSEMLFALFVGITFIIMLYVAR